MNYLNCRYFCIFFLFSLFSLSKLYSQEPNTLKIAGNLKWLAEGEKIILTILSGSQGDFHETKVDSCFVRNGKFKFSVNVVNGPRLFFLYFKNTNKFIHLFANSDSIMVEDIDDFSTILPKSGYITQYLKISGSNTTTAFKYSIPLYHLLTYYESGFRSSIQKMEDSCCYDSKLIEGLIIAKEKFSKSLMFELQDLTRLKEMSLYIPNFIVDGYRKIGKDPMLPDLYNKLSIEAKNSYYGKIMAQYLSSCIGQTAPDFDVIDFKRRKVSFFDWAKNNKLTLIYFWSLDRPRGEMILELGGLYRKYHNKGFNIVNVFTGTDSIQWRKAVEQDYLPWPQVADFRGMWDGIAKQYGFTTEVTPFTILVDSNGKIVDWLVNGALLQYYLDKIIGEHE